MYYHPIEFYHQESAAGVSYNDLVFGIEWPYEITVMENNDVNWPDWLIHAAQVISCDKARYAY
jgi:dTDP-4-dehydrorhamnose 3,5-epimerase-like enzyme